MKKTYGWAIKEKHNPAYEFIPKWAAESKEKMTAYGFRTAFLILTPIKRKKR